MVFKVDRYFYSYRGKTKFDKHDMSAFRSIPRECSVTVTTLLEATCFHWRRRTGLRGCLETNGSVPFHLSPRRLSFAKLVTLFVHSRL